MDRSEAGEGHVLVIGASGTDIIGRAHAPLQLATSNPGLLRLSQGGTARNVAENLARLGMDTVLISSVADDVRGSQLLEQTAAAGVNVEHCLVNPEGQTGYYLGILDPLGSLHLALDDMLVIEALTPAYLRARQHLFREAAAIFVDANLTPRALNTVFSLAQRARVPVAADPTTLSLAGRLIPHLAELWLLTPNTAEAAALCPYPVPQDDHKQVLRAARHLVSLGVQIAIITMAESGVGYATTEGGGHIPASRTQIADPTGAGDALMAAVIFSLLNEIPLDEAVRLGISAAALTLATPGTVVPDLSLETLYAQLR